MNEKLLELIKRYPALHGCEQDIRDAGDVIIHSLENDGILFICGNGGSAADAEHIAGELMKSYLIPHNLNNDVKDAFRNRFGDAGQYLANKLQRGLRVVALTSHPALATAVINDMGADLVFAQQLMALGRAGDVLLAISTSGNSKNVCHAVRTATVLGISTIGLTGRSGGQLKTLCRTVIHAPEDETFLIQECHLPIYHCICATIEHHFFSMAV